MGGAALQGGAVGGAIGLTGGASLLVTASATAGANVAGGIANRAIQGQKTSVKDVAIDAAVGAVAGVGAKLIPKAIAAAKSKVQSAVGEAVKDGTNIIGPSSEYLDVTGKNSIPNFQTNVNPGEFGSNLEQSGFSKTVSGDGKASVFAKGQIKYSVRQSPQRAASGTPGPSASYSNGSEKEILKIRLRK
ncbi:hypothetical protein [Mucilaginibacter sp. HD30]